MSWIMPTGYDADFWEPLPRTLDAIKAWYREYQIAKDPHGPVSDLPARVVHQIQKSLQEGLPLYPQHVERLIEYAERQ